ncbi:MULTISPECIES: hypothetical protein [Streptomyces]|uniref:Uncharacterized protein n=1 Tax=Streptomyces ramulosus TaxID=47762 RepID=A0ABW1FU47_9ACTN
MLARIDRQEPSVARQVAQFYTALGATVVITPRLQELIDNIETRGMSPQAQRLYEDIRDGDLVIHAHAHNGSTTAAVGTYLSTGTSIHLHGEDHLRQQTEDFSSTGRALRAFEDTYGDRVRPGPAPATEAERQAEDAVTSLSAPTTTPAEPAGPQHLPAYALAHDTRAHRNHLSPTPPTPPAPRADLTDRRTR